MWAAYALSLECVYVVCAVGALLTFGIRAHPLVVRLRHHVNVHLRALGSGNSPELT